MREFLRKFISPNLARLLSYLSVYRWTIAGALFFMLTAATTSSLIAVLFGKLTQIGFYDQQPWIVIAAPIGLIFVACLNGGSMFMSNFLLAKVSQSLLFQLRGELFSKILQWPEHAYQRNLTAISVAAKSVFAIMDAPLQQDAGTVVRSEVQGNIDLCDVYVRYPESEQEALKGINLSIKSGEHVALIGHSGSGKTTTVNLLPRFVEASSGVVKIDGVDVRDFTLENLRKHIAIVSQDVFLFDATIRENVAYGFPQATEDEINAAIRAAALEDVIKNLPNGLDSTVGEGGRLLSGGQKQRVSIARAFLKNAPIVILDEATSALDSESEHQIKQALTRLLDGRTCLIVAHRLSVIDNVDRIVALHEGRIVEEGTPAELLTKDGVYSKFCRLQKVH